MDKLEHYLDQVCRNIGGPRSLRQHIRQELRGHLLDAAAQHKTAGLSEEAALDRALEDFGGPEQVRSELEATHGHRLLPVVIDKAMQWKERTMRAKWLWTTWAHLAVAGVVVVQIVFFTFSQMFYVPKLRKIQREGWLAVDDSIAPTMAWLDSWLRGLEWVANHVVWCGLAVIGLWGLFEWRVRSENKSFMRLSALGTVALALMVAAGMVLSALVIPFELGMPGVVSIAEPGAREQMDRLDAAVASIEQLKAKNDWETIHEQADRASRACKHLTQVAGSIAPPRRPGQPTVADLQAHLRTATQSLWEVRQAAAAKDADALKAALKKFHEAYEPVQAAAKRPVK